MATPENTLITRAEVTSIFNPAAGRVALILDGTTVELGNTGWRDLSGQLNPLVTGRVLVRRALDTVTWEFINIVLAAGATSAQNIFAGMPGSLVEPFLPDRHTYEAVKSNATLEGRFAVLSNGSPRLDYATVGAGYSGQVSFPVRGSRTWPGTLPGVADGQPVAV